MRASIKEAVRNSLQDMVDLGIETSFTEREMRELGITIDKPVITSEEIKSIREKVHLSQSVFAKLLNVSPSSVRQWEQGTRSPSGSTKVLLELLAKEPHILDYRLTISKA